MPEVFKGPSGRPAREPSGWRFLDMIYTIAELCASTILTSFAFAFEDFRIAVNTALLRLAIFL